MLDNFCSRKVRSIGGRMAILGHDRLEAMSKSATNRRVDAEFGCKSGDDHFIDAIGKQVVGKLRV